MTQQQLEKLTNWYNSKEDAPVDHYDYEYAFEHFGELLQHAAESENEISRLRRIEKAAKEMVEELAPTVVASEVRALAIALKVNS